jgi:hypothetical protein
VIAMNHDNNANITCLKVCLWQILVQNHPVMFLIIGFSLSTGMQLSPPSGC